MASDENTHNAETGRDLYSEKNLENIIKKAHGLQVSNQHDEAIALLRPLIEHFPDNMALRRAIALIYGGKVERAMENADRFGIALKAEDLDRMEALLAQANELDPDLADTYWDLAVIQARFREDFDKAADFLVKAKALGYVHPMMPRLEEMIRRSLPDDQPGHSGKLAELLHQLVGQAQGPGSEALFNTSGHGELRTFDEYTQEGETLIKEGKVPLDAFRLAFEGARQVEGDAGEIALDFLRRLSPLMENDDLEKNVGNAHLAIIADAAHFFGGQQDVDQKKLRTARRYAQRGLDIIDVAAYAVDPDIHGDMLIAMGQTYARSTHQDLKKAISLYLQALDLKEAAGNKRHVDKMSGLLGGMVRHQIDQAIGTTLVGIGGLGKALHGIRAAYEAARRLNDANLIHESGVALAETLGAASQAQEAIEILEEISNLEGVRPEQTFSSRFVLAARLSETKRPHAIRQAREIGEEQVKLLDSAAASVAPQTVWMNLGNFRRLDGDLPGAREAFQTSLELCPVPKDNEVPLQLGQIKMLLAETEVLLDNRQEGRRLIEEVDEAFKYATGVGKLHFESLASRLMFKLGDPQASVRHAMQGIGHRKFLLTEGASPDVWESMLREWTRLDVYAVRANYAINTPEAIEQALLVAEAAKGRLYAWLVRVRAGQEAAEDALNENRQEEALKAAREWVNTGGRWLISIFAVREGLSVVGLGPDGQLIGRWLDDFDYDDFRLRVFEPWERGIAAGLDTTAPDQVTRGLAGAITELILARIGSWIGRALPEIAQGGEELVILPHRIFRSLPIAQVELPNGSRLSQCFDSISICPSLAEFGNALKQKQGHAENVNEYAFVDPDGSLPFARLEGLSTIDIENVFVGDAVKVGALEKALQEPGMLLLSCHGDFDESNPWQSVLQAYDSDVVLGDLLVEGRKIGSELVIMGICEAGKSRRSYSDEPVSFPTFLTSLGAKLAIAPAWPVDDFSSFLMITRIIREVKSGMPPACALSKASLWVCELTASSALKEIFALKEALDEDRWSFDPEVTRNLLMRLSEYERWLTEDLGPHDYPFDALDWAGFQIYGYNPRN